MSNSTPRSLAVAVLAALLSLAACAVTPTQSPTSSAPSHSAETKPPESQGVLPTSGPTLAGAGGSPSEVPSEAPLGPSAGRCADDQVEITVVDSFTAAGTVGAWLRFQNTSHRACWLHGWPELKAETAAGVTTTARRNTSGVGTFPLVTVIPTITLNPGEDAFAAFAGSDTAPGPSPTCPPAYRTLEAALPGSSHFVSRSAFISYLAAYLPACVPIEVTMMVPAASVPYLVPFRP